MEKINFMYFMIIVVKKIASGALGHCIASLHHSHDYISPQHDFLMGLCSVLGICICLAHAHVGAQKCVIIYSACVVGAVSMMT